MYFFRTNIGRLGNQMFIYAFANAISVENKACYCLSEVGQLSIFQLGFAEERFLHRFKNNLYYRWISKTRSIPTFENLNISDFFDTSNIPKTDSYFMGYFQSPVYFNKIEDRIRNRFKLKKEIRGEFLKFKDENNIPDNYTVIHIRRTDYINHKIDGLNENESLVLPVEYYLKAIAESKVKKNLVFVTDDPEFIKKQFDFLPDKFISNANWYIDFQLIQNAHICIIANSTFSWWAAWLNTKAKVYCPKYFLGFNAKKEVPQKIYPDHWTQIEF